MTSRGRAGALLRNAAAAAIADAVVAPEVRAMLLTACAELRFHEGAASDAAVLLGVETGPLPLSEFTRIPAYAARVAGLVAQVRATLGAADFESRWDEGTSLDFTGAVNRAVGGTPQPGLDA